MPPENHRFFATTAKGMESLLAEELREFKAQSVQEGRAGVSFQGTLEIAYRACLESRIANRILLPLKTFPAPDPESLYEGVRGLHWSDHLTSKNTLAVDFSTSHSKITHSHYGALKVKDAIVDQFRTLQGERPSVDLLKPDLRINVYLNQDEATLSLDLSGDSLHRRGYREQATQAPLKENLAAAILKLAGWPRGEGFAFLDPMCGSGTLPIEAASMALNRAPGLFRDYFGFLGWQGHMPSVWKRVVQQAKDAESSEFSKLKDRGGFPKIVGYDQDFRSVRLALNNLEMARLHGKVHLEKRDFLNCEPIAKNGILIVNPPYGERLGEVETLKPLYKSIGDTLKQKFKGWEAYIFTGSPELAKWIGLKASRRFVLFNGPIECRLFKYELY